MNFFHRIIDALSGGELSALRSELDEARRQLEISVRVDDSRGWEALGHHPGDRSYSERLLDIQDSSEAWVKNFFVRRIVNLMRGYVIGGGITFSSKNEDVQLFLDKFWVHRKNLVGRKLGSICDQMTKDGELFPILFTNQADGMSYVRFRTSRQIHSIDTLKNDWETEMFYIQGTSDPSNSKRWYSVNHPAAWRRTSSGRIHPVMLHWTINKPIDGLRGESDLTPVLPWAKRYQEWLVDRVRLNRLRTRQAMMDVEVGDDNLVEARKRDLASKNPISAGIYVHGKGEKATYPNLEIDAGDAEQDGKALRLAVATGANLGLHYLGEGESTNFATAKEMGEPTARFYGERQDILIAYLSDLVEAAYSRYYLWRFGTVLGDDFVFGLEANVTEVARADNLALAQAASEIAVAFASIAALGWIDDETAISLILKFAGEALSKDEIKAILAKAKAGMVTDSVSGETPGDTMDGVD